MPPVWYKDKRTLRLGDVCRYQIKFTNRDPALTRIFFRAKNTEKAGLRAFHLVNGPFIAYCHVIPCNYDPHMRFVPESAENDEVCFKNTLKPGQTFNVPLRLNGNSLDSVNADGLRTYAWSCDLMCQIVLNRLAALRVVVMVGEDLCEMRRASRSALTSLSKGEMPYSAREAESDVGFGVLVHPGLHVLCADTDELWPRQPRVMGAPIHLVVITHGIFLNLTADMLYLRDMLLSIRLDNYLVDGFRGNAGRTDKGIHRLGVGVSGYVTGRLAALRAEGHRVARLSFVGHSLGGPVQLYALKHILTAHGTDYFERQGVRLMHFVCLASPMLGVISEVSLWISWFLDLGTLGKTGRDLTLLKKLPNIKRHAGTRLGMVRPVLETLPDEPVALALRAFLLRVVYANAVNDGIVPLRTSALLYLDWEALGDVRDLKENLARDNADPKNGVPVDAGHGDSLGSLAESPAETLVENLAESVATENLADGLEQSPPVSPGKARHSNGLRETLMKSTNDHKLSTDADLVLEKGPDTQVSKSADVGQVPDDSELNILEKYIAFLARIFSIDGEPSRRKGRRSKRIKKSISRYARISAKGSDLSESVRTRTDSAGDDEVSSLNIPPKASAVESAFNSLICPIPSRDYIDDPDTRTPVIFHDKFYHFSSIPDSESHTGAISKFFRYYDWRMDKQVKIARKYHAPGLSWRKVLVYLPPDAHNNIVVRRRFANGYGWGVIEHLRQEVFGGEEVASRF